MSRFRFRSLFARFPAEQAETVEPVTTPEPVGCRCGDPDCIDCWVAGIRYADHLQAKQSEEWFI